MLKLPISNGFFCLIIDTYNESQLWKEIFGCGSFKKISIISEGEFPAIKSIEFFNSLKDFLSDIAEVNEENIHEKEINIDINEFNSYEKSCIKSILNTW